MKVKIIISHNIPSCAIFPSMMEDLRDALEDAGCDEAMLERIAALYEEGRLGDARQLLRLYRGRLLSSLHACNGKLETLDLLIRNLDMEMKENGRKADTDK